VKLKGLTEAKKLYSIRYAVPLQTSLIPFSQLQILEFQ